MNMFVHSLAYSDFCIIINFNNPLKACFRIRNTYYNPNTPYTTVKSIFLIEKPVFSGFLKIICVQH